MLVLTYKFNKAGMLIDQQQVKITLNKIMPQINAVI